MTFNLCFWIPFNLLLKIADLLLAFFITHFRPLFALFFLMPLSFLFDVALNLREKCK